MDEVEQRPRSRSCSVISEADMQCADIEVQQFGCEDMCDMNAGSPDSVIIGASRPEKRMWNNNTSKRGLVDDEGFILVQKKPKCIVVNKTEAINKKNTKVLNHKKYFEVCVSSYQALPKQIGLAKLLKSENIINAAQIKYKSQYKVIIYFDNQEDANKLIGNKQFSDLGYRCYSPNEVEITYGVVKYLELDVKEEDLMQSLHCEQAIVSVKRLKRASETGLWVESETVRFGFKSSTLPSYIYGYGGRFKVEPYTFPVTQCSACWKYGHLTRTCPAKGPICPKCGEGHANCEATEFRCVNCKGEHRSFDKSCPIYLKERKIRLIMSSDNCTYRSALTKYSQWKASTFNILPDVQTKDTTPLFMFGEEVNSSRPFEKPSILYSQAIGSKTVQTKALVHQESVAVPESQDNVSIEECVVSRENINDKKQENKKQKKQKKESTLSTEPQSSSAGVIKPAKEGGDILNADENKGILNSVKRVFNKSKEIVFSEKSFMEKVVLVMQLLFEEFMPFIVKTMSNREVLSKVMGLFHDG